MTNKEKIKKEMEEYFASDEYKNNHREWFKSLILKYVKEFTFINDNYFFNRTRLIQTGNPEEDDVNYQMTEELFYELIKELIKENKINLQLYTSSVESNIHSLFIDAEKEIKFL